MDHLGSKIRKLREGHSLSLEQLGRICGVTGAAVAQWESGSTTNIKLDPFLRLCAYFGVDPYDLVFSDDKDRPLPPATGRFRRLPRP